MTIFIADKNKNVVGKYEVSGYDLIPEDKQNEYKAHVDKIATKAWLQEQSLNISAACRMDSEYDPLDDIKDIIKDFPKPDVLVITDRNNNQTVYCNAPSLMGKVCLLSESSPSLINFDVLTPKEIGGDPDEWTCAMLEEKQINLKEFLKRFILSNS